MSRSIPLLNLDSDSKFFLNPQASQFLQSLPANNVYYFCTVIGKTKTGKSFLLNNILEQKHIFKVSKGLDTCTKGIQMATKMLPYKDGYLIFLDTEGFGGLEGNENRDCRLFLMSMLISSTIIFNGFGAIDQQTLSNLSMIIEIGKAFTTELSTTKNERELPDLIWLLRDCSLQLQDESGNPITPDQYLNKGLRQSYNAAKSHVNKNQIRRAIKSVFRNKNCQTMVLPSNDIHFDGQKPLRKQFRRDLQRLKHKLFASDGRKNFSGKQIVFYLKSYSNSFNNNNTIPTLHSISTQVMIAEIGKQIRDFQKEMSDRTMSMCIEKQKNKSQVQIQEQIMHYYGLQQKRFSDSLAAQFSELEMEGLQIQSKLNCLKDSLKKQTRQTIMSRRTQERVLTNFDEIHNLQDLQKNYNIKSQQPTDNSLKPCCQQNISLKLEIAYLNKKITLLQKDSIPNIECNRRFQNPTESMEHSYKSIKIVNFKQNSYKSFYLPYLIISEIRIEVNKTLVKEDSKHHKFIEFMLDIYLHQAHWVVYRKVKDFMELAHIIQIMFPEDSLPILHFSVQEMMVFDLGTRNSLIQGKRYEVQTYLRDLTKLDFVRNSRIFQKFIKVNKQYLHVM